MKPNNEEAKLIELQRKAAKPRFQIEKLEERIAPAKGGIPGPPDGNGDGGNGSGNGKHCNYNKGCRG